MPSIDFPGTRVVEGFLKYSSTRVVVLSTRIYKIKQSSYFFHWMLNLSYHYIIIIYLSLNKID